MATDVSFSPLDIESAPEKSRGNLDAAQAGYGFVPNMLGTMANSPQLLEAYSTLTRLFKETSFTPQEQQFIFLTASIENHCPYCTSAHSFVLQKNFKVDQATVDAMQTGDAPDNEKWAALVGMTRELVRHNGAPSEATIERFLEAGYQETQLLELLVGIAAKTLSNSLDHISPVALDDAFQTPN